jgi:rhodanese-related sulfurtransferase
MSSNGLKKTALIIGLIIAILTLVVIVYLKAIAPSFVGRVGPEGSMLKQYLEPVELKKLTGEPAENVWIIDVRSAKAYQKGHIPTAKSFPSREIEANLNEIPRDHYLVLYCETGGRVQTIVKKLERHGYSRYMNWGGFSRWPYETEPNL